MRKITLFFTLLMTVFMFSCGEVEEKEKKSDKKNKKEKAEKIVQTDTTKNSDTIANTGSNDIEEEEIVTTENVKAEGEVKKDNSKGKENVMIENADGSTSKVSNEELKKSGTTGNAKKFYVIAGSFKDATNAQKSRKFYRTAGYKAIILNPEKGWYRVATGAYANRELAEKAIGEARKKTKSDTQGKQVAYWLLLR